MIHADIGDDGEDRGDDVRTIESPAQSHFYDGYIDVLRYKIAESECGHCLEERRLCGIQEIPILLDECDYFRFRDRCSVHAYPFAQIHQMRAGIETYFESRSLQDGCYQMGGRTFSVRTRHMYCTQMFMRISDVRHQLQCVLQTGLVSSCADLMKRRTGGIQIVYRFLITHSLLTTLKFKMLS